MTSRTLISLVFSLLACTLATSVTFPETPPSSARPTTEPVLIRTLLDAATSYQGHAIAVVGTATAVEQWPPVRGKCGIHYDRYVFDLKDESGSIRVEVMGTCGIQGDVELARNGDRVLVEGVFIQLRSGNFSSPTPFIHALNRAVRRLLQ